jgi:hypothetical protein
MIEIEFPFSSDLRDRFRPGKLIDEWASRYPRLFDKQDVQLANNQNPFHFFEWLGAVLLYESTGYLSLVEKYGCKSHRRKTKILRKTVPDCVFDYVMEDSAGVPDLFAYRPDYRDWFFCEIKGLRDRIRAPQLECCKKLKKISHREMRILTFREIRF